VLAHEGAEAIFEAEAGEEGGFPSGGLAIEVEFGGPPAGYAIFEFGGESAEAMALRGLAQSCFGFDFEVAGLLEVVGVGDEVGLFLRLQGRDNLAINYDRNGRISNINSD
jgi:hypothetical protein